MDDIRLAVRDATTANRRAEQAEQRGEKEQARANWGEQKSAAFRAELVELRISERAATDLAEYATGEAVDLRKRLDAAEQRADAERTRADRIEQQLTAVEAELVTARTEAVGLRCLLEQARPKPPKTRWHGLLRALGHTR